MKKLQLYRSISTDLGIRVSSIQAVSLFLVVGVLAAFLWENHDVAPQIDDAYISYRYARNLVEGYGLVYNPGEYVEGYSNLLWTLLIAGALSIGAKAENASHILGIISACLALVSAYLFACYDLPKKTSWVAAFVPWIMFFSVAFPLWSTSGLETPLFVVASLATLFFYTHRYITLSLISLMLATLTRPDGLLVGFPVSIAYFVSVKGTWINRSIYGLAYLIFLVGLTAFRLLYYDAFLPNTFYAKVGGVPLITGAWYFIDFLTDGAVYLVIPAVVSMIYRPAHRLSASIALLFVFYVIIIGGDAFWDSRFLLVPLAILSVMGIHGTVYAWMHDALLGTIMIVSCIAFCVWSFFGAGSKTFIAVMTSILLCYAILSFIRKKEFHNIISAASLAMVAITMALRSFPIPLTADTLLYGKNMPIGPVARSQRIADIHKFNRLTGLLMERLSRLLSTEYQEGQLVAAVGIGKLGYTSRFRILDLVGIVDPVVARNKQSRSDESGLKIPGHQRSSPQYILDRRPHFILIPRKTSNVLPAARELSKIKDFSRLYYFDTNVLSYRLR